MLECWVLGIDMQRNEKKVTLYERVYEFLVDGKNFTNWYLWMFEKTQSGIGSKYDYKKPQDLKCYEHYILNVCFTNSKYIKLLT